MRFVCAILSLMLLASGAQAGAGLTYHGRLLRPDGLPVTASSVQFRIQIRSPGSENCLLYEELQTKNMSQSNGIFALTLNDGSGVVTLINGYSMSRIFQNRGTFSLAGHCVLGNAYTPNQADGREISVEFHDGGGWEPMPTLSVNYVPLSIDSMSVGGYSSENLLRVEDAGVLQSVSALNSTQFNALLSIANTGNISGQAASATNFSGSLSGDVTGTQNATSVTRLQGRDVLSTAPANGEVLKWNGTAWAPAADGGGGGSVTAVNASAPLSSSGGATPSIALSAGTVAGQSLRWGGASWSAAKLNYQDLVNNASASPWPAASCTSGQFLTWSSVSDNFACTAVSGAMINTALGYTPLNPANNLSDLANAATARTNLGAGDFLASGTVPMTGNIRLNSNWLSNDGGNEGIAIDNSGNVGVGTVTPTGKFDVEGSAYIGNSATNAVRIEAGLIRMQDNLDAGRSLELQATKVSVGANNARAYSANSSALLNVASSTNGTQLFKLRTNDETGTLIVTQSSVSSFNLTASQAGNPQFHLANNGNVGVGTNNPQALLHVNGLIRATEICDENGTNCRDISTGWGGAGTVTSVTSANSDLTITNTTSTPELTLNSGTGANQIVKLNASSELPAVSGANLTSLNASNLASGTLPAGRLPALTGDATLSAGNSVTTVERIRGRTVSATAPAEGQVYRWNNGLSQWEPVYFGVDDLRTAAGASQFSASCTASQTLTWSAVTDAFTCSNITGLDAGVLGSGVVADARLPDSAKYWQSATGGIHYSGGLVGIGTSAPIGPLQVMSPGQTSISNSSLATTENYSLGAMSTSTGKIWSTLHVQGQSGANLSLWSNNSATGLISGIKFPYLPRSSTDENAASIASVTAFNTTNDATSGGGLVFRTRPTAGGTLNERVRLDADGNLGVGTSNPARLLHVNGPMRLAAGALPGSPALGDIAVDSGDSNKLKYYNGTQWIDLATGGPTDVELVMMNPFVIDTTVTAPHGLGTNPKRVIWYIENITAEHGYSPGDRLYHVADSGGGRGISVFSNTTHIGVATDAELRLVSAAINEEVMITPARWRVGVIVIGSGGGGGGGSAPLKLLVHDQKAAGTEGGTLTAGSWVTRTLNTVALNQIPGASLSSNQITLPAGTYNIEISVPASNVGENKALLYNVTDATNSLIGSSENAEETTVGYSKSLIRGQITIGATKVFEVRHRSQFTQSTNGMGRATNFGVPEIYTQVMIEKVP